MCFLVKLNIMPTTKTVFANQRRQSTAFGCFLNNNTCMQRPVVKNGSFGIKKNEQNPGLFKVQKGYFLET